MLYANLNTTGPDPCHKLSSSKPNEKTSGLTQQRSEHVKSSNHMLYVLIEGKEHNALSQDDVGHPQLKTEVSDYCTYTHCTDHLSSYNGNFFDYLLVLTLPKSTDLLYILNLTAISPQMSNMIPILTCGGTSIVLCIWPGTKWLSIISQYQATGIYSA